jgi:hypothetical protein
MTCPWCHKPLADADATCPSCRRDPRHHPSRARAAVPDLALAAPIATASSSAAVEELEIDAPSLDLALDLRAAPVVITPSGGELEDDDAPLALETELAPRAPVALAEAAPPMLAFAEAPAPVVDAIEILALADYGPAPSGWVDAIPYAVRVVLRERALRRDLERHRAALVGSERARDQALVRMVEATREAGGAHADTLAARLSAVDALAKDRDDARRAASREYAGEVARIDAQVAELERTRETQDAHGTAAEEELGRRREAHARAAAKVKRVEIALRAAHDAARLAAGPDAKHAPPEHAAKIRDLEAERELRATELRPFQQALDEATAASRAREAELRETQKAIARLRDERRAIERSAARQLELRSAGADEAERARETAYAEAGRELLRLSPEAAPTEQRAAAEQAQRLVDDRALTLEKHARAVTAFDAQGKKRGLVVLGVAGALFVLLVALAARVVA